MRPLTTDETSQFLNTVTSLIISYGGELDNSGGELYSDNSHSKYKHFLIHTYKDGDNLNLGEGVGLGNLDNEPVIKHILFYLDTMAGWSCLEVSYPETEKNLVLNVLEALSKLYNMRPCNSISESIGGTKFTKFKLEVRPLELD